MDESMPGVLAVDGERFFREAIRDALAEASIDCETAASADEARRFAEDPRVGVVLLDVALPGADSVELLRQLREARPAVRAIVLSAQDEQERVLEALRLGACDYLAKPLHDEELVLAVRRALEAYAVESRLAALRARVRALDSCLVELSAPTSEIDGAQRFARVAARGAEAAAEVLGASKTSVMELEPDSAELRVVATTGRDLAPDEMDRVAMGEGVAGSALAGGKPLLVDDIERDGRFAGRAPPGRYEAGAFAVVPLVWGGRPLGVLCATDREGGGAFGEDELALLQILARQLGPLLADSLEAVDRGSPALRSPGDSDTQPIGLLPTARVGVDDAEIARMICEALTSEIEPDRLIDAALRPVARGLPAGPVSLYLIDAQSRELALEGQCEGEGSVDRPRLPTDAGLTATVLQTGRLVATDHPETDPRFDADVDTPEGGAIGPLLCVPVRLRGKVLGVLRAFPARGTSASARTGEILSAAFSAAVRNVLLYRSLLESVDEVAKARRGQERIESER